MEQQWTVIGLLPGFRGYANPTAARFIAHGVGPTAIEGKWNALDQVAAAYSDWLEEYREYPDSDLRDLLIVLAVLPGYLTDCSGGEVPAPRRESGRRTGV